MWYGSQQMGGSRRYNTCTREVSERSNTHASLSILHCSPTQVGDILDRGDHELQIFYLLERLQGEAQRAGGRLHVLNGVRALAPFPAPLQLRTPEDASRPQGCSLRWLGVTGGDRCCSQLAVVCRTMRP